METNNQHRTIGSENDITEDQRFESELESFFDVDSYPNKWSKKENPAEMNELEFIRFLLEHEPDVSALLKENWAYIPASRRMEALCIGVAGEQTALLRLVQHRSTGC